MIKPIPIEWSADYKLEAMTTTEQDRAQMELERNAAEDKGTNMTTATPISDANKILSEPHGYPVVPYSVAQELEREMVGWEAAAHFWQDTYGREMVAVRSKQAKLDTLMLEFCPKEMTEDQRDKWGQNQKPAEIVQYYYSLGDCPAISAESKGCICWHDEGTGPDERAKHNALPSIYKWRVKPNSSLDVVENRKAEIESLRARNTELECKVTEIERQAKLVLGLAECRRKEIIDLRARNDKLYAELTNERILRYAETERCAKIAREYDRSPFDGRAIAALIMNKGE